MTPLPAYSPPCVLFEDEHILVIDKPARMNTHAPAPYAGEGVHEWLRHREPRWASLAIIHRLDKDTSGVLVFGKTPVANQSLTRQFTTRQVTKRYHFLTDHPVRQTTYEAQSWLQRVGERYASLPAGSNGDRAVTRFRLLQMEKGLTVMEATPLTGRTHQIRVHAADLGFPILGDVLYGGTPSPRICLHARELCFKHPATGEPLSFHSDPSFDGESILALRQALINPAGTNAYRVIHGAADGFPGFYLDRLGDFLLCQSDAPLAPARLAQAIAWAQQWRLRGIYHKTFNRRVRQPGRAPVNAERVWGEAAAAEIIVIENGVQYELRFDEGYSVGLFLDQRDNRRRLRTGHVAADYGLSGPGPDTPLEVLNTFAYTCGFSACAALGGARCTNIDLSQKYLDWGRRNFEINGLDAAGHEFLKGDVFEWLKRLAKKGRRFDVVILDPPTFSTSKASGVFRVERDYGRLVRGGAAVLKPGGILFASANTAGWSAGKFVETVFGAVTAAKRRVRQQHYVPQPPDFPMARDEPAYLKTIWIKMD